MWVLCFQVIRVSRATRHPTLQQLSLNSNSSMISPFKRTIDTSNKCSASWIVLCRTNHIFSRLSMRCDSSVVNEIQHSWFMKAIAEMCWITHLSAHMIHSFPHTHKCLSKNKLLGDKKNSSLPRKDSSERLNKWTTSKEDSRNRAETWVYLILQTLLKDHIWLCLCPSRDKGLDLTWIDR
jgi:hypothetical protein